MVADRKAGIETAFAGLEAKLQVSFAVHDQRNAKVQQQLAQTEEMMQETRSAAANNGGAGTLRGPKIRKEDCNVDRLKETTGVVDFRQ